MRVLILAVLATLIVGCSPIEPESPHPDDVVLQPVDLAGDHWRSMPTGYWGGFASSGASCEGGDAQATGTADAFARSDAFASTAISSNRYTAAGIFTMVLRLPTTELAETVEHDFAESFEGREWADCYAERLKESFATEFDVVPELTESGVAKDGLHTAAATFDLESMTGLLYRSEMYAWRSGRLVIYVGIVGPDVQLAAVDIPEVVNVLWGKSGR